MAVEGPPQSTVLTRVLRGESPLPGDAAGRQSRPRQRPQAQGPAFTWVPGRREGGHDRLGHCGRSDGRAGAPRGGASPLSPAPGGHAAVFVLGGTPSHWGRKRQRGAQGPGRDLALGGSRAPQTGEEGWRPTASAEGAVGRGSRQPAMGTDESVNPHPALESLPAARPSCRSPEPREPLPQLRPLRRAQGAVGSTAGPPGGGGGGAPLPRTPSLASVALWPWKTVFHCVQKPGSVTKSVCVCVGGSWVLRAFGKSARDRTQPAQSLLIQTILEP